MYYVCIRMYVCMYVHTTCTYACMYVCMYVCIYIRMYQCLHDRMWTRQKLRKVAPRQLKDILQKMSHVLSIHLGFDGQFLPHYKCVKYRYIHTYIHRYIDPYMCIYICMYRSYMYVFMYMQMYIYQVLHSAVKTRIEVVERLRQLHRRHLLRQLSERADVELQHLCVCVCVCVCVCGMCVYITTFCGSSLSAQISSCSAHVYTHAYIFA